MHEGRYFPGPEVHAVRVAATFAGDTKYTQYSISREQHAWGTELKWLINKAQLRRLSSVGQNSCKLVVWAKKGDTDQEKLGWLILDLRSAKLNKHYHQAEPSTGTWHNLSGGLRPSDPPQLKLVYAFEEEKAAQGNEAEEMMKQLESKLGAGKTPQAQGQRQGQAADDYEDDFEHDEGDSSTPVPAPAPAPSTSFPEPTASLSPSLMAPEPPQPGVRFQDAMGPPAAPGAGAAGTSDPLYQDPAPAPLHTMPAPSHATTSFPALPGPPAGVAGVVGAPLGPLGHGQASASAPYPTLLEPQLAPGAPSAVQVRAEGRGREGKRGHLVTYRSLKDTL